MPKKGPRHKAVVRPPLTPVGEDAKTKLLNLYPETAVVFEWQGKKNKFCLKWFELILCEWLPTEEDCWVIAAGRHCKSVEFS